MSDTDTTLVVGGTRFIGRHVVEDLLAHGYEVTTFNRGNHENPFAEDDVSRVEGDRTDETDLRTAKLSVEPDIVVDCVAYHPGEVETAVDVFADVDGYVYISSGSAYAAEEIPKREGETALCDCTDEQATDDSDGTYGPRKAEGDRVVARAADDGVNAMSVRPCIVYGPHDYTERLDYWLARVDAHDRVVVPGDGTNLWHRAYVEDVASALRVVAEEGTPGEAYNVGDRRLVTLAEMVDLIADVAGADCEVVPASDRELSTAGLSSTDFPLYREYPHVLDTTKLASLGWESTPLREAMERTLAEHRDSERDGRERGPDRETEARVLGVLDTV
ncbi:NAD-dependent epimerase/dehydratase family protein [Candidatus Halobonum tyrrellensis]|uniref:Nucleoside-diphosphate-sugar epimerase n=1 Tax=Candidatus Halobonum tyrrellensis G22 TaxID=1324957 RepID=V4GW19_9EURY|nr:NAD-dependent epimerase/dehydratase family protein [Candidatus Halobonum tyrrellensis]ESP89326.1 nucleoside-diphosphate-sugar epimerase [Candidatus Halobonum tyrrellensis G22]